MVPEVKPYNGLWKRSLVTMDVRVPLGVQVGETKGPLDWSTITTRRRVILRVEFEWFFPHFETFYVKFFSMKYEYFSLVTQKILIIFPHKLSIRVLNLTS